MTGLELIMLGLLVLAVLLLVLVVALCRAADLPHELPSADAARPLGNVTVLRSATHPPAGGPGRSQRGART